MLSFSGGSNRFCDGINRRNFLKIGAFGSSLSLTDMLRAKEAGKTGTAKSAIMIYLVYFHLELPIYVSLALTYICTWMGIVWFMYAWCINFKFKYRYAVASCDSFPDYTSSIGIFSLLI